MNIYLDIDGVILTKEGKQMAYLKEFLDYIFTLSPQGVYWLTTHCKDGTTVYVFKHLYGKLDKEVEEYIKKIKPVSWKTLKTEAIDFNNDFLWFDDNLLTAEYQVLENHKRLESWIKVEENLEKILEKPKTKYL